MTAQFRPARPSDHAVVRTLVDEAIATAGYGDAPSYFLRIALDGRASESRIFIVERNGEAVGCALFGEVAGAVGTGRIHFVGVSPGARRCGLAAGLCDAAVTDLAAHGARSVVAEVPDDAALTTGLAMLGRCGFVEAGRVVDFYRDGVDLLIFQRIVPSAR